MTKQRDGYHNVNTQLPSVVWDALVDDCEAQSESVAQRLAAILADHYRIPKTKIPAPKRTGRRPKKER